MHAHIHLVHGHADLVFDLGIAGIAGGILIIRLSFLAGVLEILLHFHAIDLARASGFLSTIGLARAYGCICRTTRLVRSTRWVAQDIRSFATFAPALCLLHHESQT